VNLKFYVLVFGFGTPVDVEHTNNNFIDY